MYSLQTHTTTHTFKEEFLVGIIFIIVFNDTKNGVYKFLTNARL